MDSTRIEDLKIIEEGIKKGSSADRRQAMIAKERILAQSNEESNKLRQELVAAHRSRDKGKIEDLHRKLELKDRRIKDKIQKYYGNRRGYF